MYMAICTLESFTGGDGDGDCDVQEQIDTARKHGKSVGGLSAKVYKEWSEQGWIDLFHSRYVPLSQ